MAVHLRSRCTGWCPVVTNLVKSCLLSTPYLVRITIATGSVLLVLLWLLFSQPNYKQDTRPVYSGPCPVVKGARGNDPMYYADKIRDKQSTASAREVDCQKLINGEKTELNYTSQFNWCKRGTNIKDSDYIEETKDCDNFKNSYGYNRHVVSKVEQDFPIAFSILTFENTEQTERLLRAIYRPHNVYCLHVDGKASSSMLQALASLSKCFPNVIVPTKPVIVHWAEISVLLAEILCLKELWQHSVKWKYFINLTGREYPLKSNLEIVNILKSYDGANDIDGSRYNRNRDWTDYVWRAEYWRTNTKKGPVPHNFNIHKGSAHIVASRAFIDYALHDKRAQDLLEWMTDTRLPDEHFFNTLNFNPQLGVPGAYLGDPALKPFYGRHKLWWKNKQSQCSGEWSHYICNVGPQELKEISQSKHLFLNKIKLEVSPVTYRCLQQWYWNKTTTKPQQNTIDINFYKKLNFVANHVKKV